MLILLIICSALCAGYVLLMAVYGAGWVRQPSFALPDGYTPATSIAVIIPARNEEENIGMCIAAVLAQHYPEGLLEVIVVDDHSEDNTAAIAARYAGMGVRCVSLSAELQAGTQVNAYKKAALTAGIKHSHGTLIVTTDADCTAPPLWLKNIAAIYEQLQPVMIAGPVVFTDGSTLSSLFQQIDFMCMQGITAAAHSLRLGNMGNGANLAFSRDAYEAVNGYEGVQHLASGDDYLLMMKMRKRWPDGIAYLKAKDAIVSTPPQTGWRAFLRQRVRWASKSGKYDDHKLTAALLLVYLFNVSFLALGIAAFWCITCLYAALALLAAKTAAEYIFLLPVSRFYGKRGALRYYPLLQPLHIGYIIIAGFLGMAGGYKWKGRKVR